MVVMHSTLFRAIILRVSFLAIIVCTLALILMDNVEADEYASAMVGVFNSGKKSLAETKLVNIGHREYGPGGLCFQYEGGGWVDSVGQGRSGSAYGALQVGVEAGDTVIARVVTGPALISSPDEYLGGIFQFSEDFFMGIRGNSESTVGIKYKHFSSAGLEQPNVGRDFMGVEAAIHF